MSAAAEVRDLGWIRWKDPRAWMEAMRGTRWNALVAKERQRFETAVAAAAGDPAQLEAAVAAFEVTSQEAAAASSWILQRGTVRLRVSSQLGGVYSWTFTGGERPPSFPYAGDIAIGSGGIILTTEDRKGGQEVYAVVARSSRGQPLWSYQGSPSGGVAQHIAVLGRRVFLVEAISPLQYKRLVSIDLATGKGRSVVFEDLHPSVNLRLIKGQRECLFLLAENAGYQALYHVQPTGGCQRLAPDGVAFYPVGYGAGAGTRPPSFFVRRGSFSAPWCAVGTPLEDWTLPAAAAAAAGIDFCSLTAGLLVTRTAGIRTLYRCGRRRPPSQLGTLLGELEFNPWDAWYGRLGLEGRIPCIATVPGATPTEGIIDMRHGLTLEHPFSVYAGRRLTGTARSRDGTAAPWVVCWNDQRPPVGLIVCGYGAYGIPTHLSTTRWKPFLERGIAIGFALVRGGGDSGEAWAEAGRLAGKERGVEDFEACVRALQGIVDVPPSATALFGRSAGGYLVGSTVARNPDGGLAGVAYCEVPYVDVLRTASNPALPLTSLEYLEFGQPAEKVADFEMLLRLSPIEALGPEGAPGVFVLCRTATEDRQVYAYESFKWVDALRGSEPRWARPKLVGLTRGSGHFVRGAQGSIERAEDYLVLVRELLRKE